MQKKSITAKCPIPNRIRKKLQVTLDPDIYNRIKDSGVNASRLIDKAVSALFSRVDPVYLLVSSKEAQNQWARRDLNPRPPGYEPGALTGLSYGPENWYATGLNSEMMHISQTSGRSRNPAAYK